MKRTAWRVGVETNGEMAQVPCNFGILTRQAGSHLLRRFIGVSIEGERQS